MANFMNRIPGIGGWFRRRRHAVQPASRPIRHNYVLTPGVSQISLNKVLQLGQPSVHDQLAGLLNLPIIQKSGLPSETILQHVYEDYSQINWDLILKYIPERSGTAVSNRISDLAILMKGLRKDGAVIQKIEQLRPIVNALDVLQVCENHDNQKTYDRPALDGAGFIGRYQDAAVTLAGLLQQTLHNLPADRRGQSGPLGAELTTMLNYASQENRSEQDLSGARMVILSSHSWKGLFTAHLLQRFFCDYWKMDASPNNIHIVDDLVSRPNNANTALETLALWFQTELRGSQTGDPFQWDNTFIMTSGFKSVIPCMTIFALIYGVEMIYTFETSDQIQSLHPRYNLSDPESRNFWVKTWNGMEARGWAGESASPYLRIALQGRLKDIQLTFSSPA